MFVGNDSCLSLLNSIFVQYLRSTKSRKKYQGFLFKSSKYRALQCVKNPGLEVRNLSESGPRQLY